MTDLRMKRGDDASFSVAAYQADGVTALDLTGATIRFTAKDRPTDDDVDAVIAISTPSAITIDDAPGGLATITIPASDTDAFTGPRTLVWDLQVTTSTGSVVTVDGGKLYVLLDVTRTA
jgi:hypothetical protein